MGFGQNASGDFDQLSLAGVDFGENYTKKRFGTKIHTLGEGDGAEMSPADSQGEGSMEYGCENMDGVPDFGSVPEGLHMAPDFGRHPDMGLVPAGMGRPYGRAYDMAMVPQGLGNGSYQLGRMGVYPQGLGAFSLTGTTVVAGFAIPNIALYAGLAAAAWWAYKKYM